ncbi:MAG: hypothetical protein IT210_03865 [Armatimonadetes bacterium]|nr:hypothetical protein [Armatimonadota bacterium]
MLTIGDVLAVIGSVMLICVSTWALLMAMALLFEGRVAQAEIRLMMAPGRAFGAGLLLAVTVGLFAVALLSQANGLVKLIGWSLFLGLLLVSALGASGLARLIGHRIEAVEKDISPLRAYGRGAAICVAAGLVPMVGWFLITPALLMVSLGAGFQAIRHRTKPVESHPAPAGAEAIS